MPDPHDANNQDAARRALADRIARYLDGEATEADVAALNASLADDPAARDLYVAMCMQAGLLSEMANAQAPAEDDTPADDVAPVRAMRGGAGTQAAPAGRIGLIRYAAAAAVLIAAAATVALLSRPDAIDPDAQHTVSDVTPSTRAVLLDGGNAVWADADDNDTSFDGGELTSRVLRLKAGSAEIALGRGAVVTLIGQTDLRITGDNACEVDRGTVLARVLGNAHGFAIVTPRARVVDRGTVFGVTVDRYGRTEVHVIEGLVEATALHANATPVKLTADHALRVDDALTQPIAVERERFATLSRWLPKNVALIDRPRDSQQLGNVYLLARPFDTAGEVERWAFFDDNNAGRQVTPILCRRVDDTWQIIAIGATRTSDGSGIQRFDFEPAAGRADVRKGDAFGWKEGGVDTDNAGVINHELHTGETPVLYFGPNHTRVRLGDRLEAEPRYEDSSYSIQVQIRPRVDAGAATN
ncbi:MAG: hypothetical protein GC159_01940 [Phycisphaera sp.]|nr:hypothetical protein [Phycisphaera sp.]